MKNCSRLLKCFTVSALVASSLLLIANTAFATISVIFLQVQLKNGTVLQYEPKGRFAHVAISYQGKWLHAYPGRGVEIISQSDLEKLGQVTDVIDLKDQPDLTPNRVQPFIGKAYDMEFNWSDDKIYSSELVAKLLGLTPEPMTFSAPFWPQAYSQLKGLPGLSPDDIYRLLLKSGYKPHAFKRSCSAVLE